MPGQLRAIVEQHYADIRDRDWDRMRRLFADDVVTEMPGAGTINGVDDFITFAQGFSRALPDMHMIAGDIIESSDTVIAEGHVRGTHNGALITPTGREIAATGRPVELRFADVFKVRDGKVVAHHVYFDQLELMTQLGLVPEGAPA